MSRKNYAADFAARKALQLWADKGRQLKQERRLLEQQFQPEPDHPELVGLDEADTDSLSPEALVELYVHWRSPHWYDPDAVDQQV